MGMEIRDVIRGHMQKWPLQTQRIQRKQAIKFILAENYLNNTGLAATLPDSKLSYRRSELDTSRPIYYASDAWMKFVKSMRGHRL